MCPQVSLEFIGAGETFPAEDPIADEGPLPGMPSEMGLQVRGFAVHFIAIGVVTYVHLKHEKTTQKIVEKKVSIELFL